MPPSSVWSYRIWRHSRTTFSSITFSSFRLILLRLCFTWKWNFHVPPPIATPLLQTIVSFREHKHSSSSTQTWTWGMASSFCSSLTILIAKPTLFTWALMMSFFYWSSTPTVVYFYWSSTPTVVCICCLNSWRVQVAGRGNLLSCI
jgi:hypothetical protein